MKYLALSCALFLAGCGGPYHVTVYGKTGATYQAPDLCAALIACQKAGEMACSYYSSTTTTLDGKSFETEQCKTIQTK